MSWWARKRSILPLLFEAIRRHSQPFRNPFATLSHSSEQSLIRCRCATKTRDICMQQQWIDGWESGFLGEGIVIVTESKDMNKLIGG